MTNGRHYIAGKWRSDAAKTFVSTNPARLSETIGVFPLGTKADADEAVAAARKAFPAWRRTSRILRAELFDRLAQLVTCETADALATLMARECGKVVTECRAEVIEGLHMIQYVLPGTGRMAMGEVLSSEIAEKDTFMRRKPWGVAAVITPWNFPFAVPLWMLGPSLVEGNTVVFKPSEDTPAIGQRIVELFEEAGFPAGVINLIQGEGEAGEALVRNPGVNCVLFTGSYDVGKRIAEISAGFHDRIVASETGSKSAVIVAEDAKLDLAVTSGLISAFKTSGQRCVSAGRLLIHEKLIDAYAEKLVSVAKRLKIGDPLDANNFTGPLINKTAVEKVERYNALSKEEGADILLQGGRIYPPLPSGGGAEVRRPTVASFRRTFTASSTAPTFAASAKRFSAPIWPSFLSRTMRTRCASITTPIMACRWRSSRKIIAPCVISAMNANTAWATSICRASAPRCIYRSAASRRAATAIRPPRA